MATAGPNFPATASNSAADGAIAWQNPGNVSSDNGTEATISATTFDNGVISHYLLAQNYSFAVPDGSTINGITMAFERRATAGGAVDRTINMFVGGTIAPDNKAAGGTWAGLSTVTYGGAADTWGRTWTPTEINSANFGAIIQCNANANDSAVAIDFVRVMVTYTEPQLAAEFGVTCFDGGQVTFISGSPPEPAPTVFSSYVNPSRVRGTNPGEWTERYGFGRRTIDN